MKVYIDLVLIINFFIDLIILMGVSKVLKLKVKFRRLIISSVVGALSSLLLFIKLNSLVLNLVKLGISFFIVFVCFGKRNIIKNVFYFYVVSIILGGAIYLFDISFFKAGNIYTNFLILLIICPIVIFIYIKEQLSYKNNVSNIYKVVLTIDKKKYELRGFLDTGNRLRDPYHKRSVILLNNDIKINKSRYIIIPYKALNYEGIVRCFKPDKVMVDDKEFSNCLIGLSNNNLGLDVDCILPNKFKEDL